VDLSGNRILLISLILACALEIFLGRAGTNTRARAFAGTQRSSVLGVMKVI
jgi:hypothetical protein